MAMPCLQPHQLREHHRARHDGNALRARAAATSGLSGLDRGGRDHRIGTADIRFVVADVHFGPQLLQTLGHGALGKVGAAHLEAQVEHDLGDSAHSGAADADEVHVLDLVLHDGTELAAMSGLFALTVTLCLHAGLHPARMHVGDHARGIRFAMQAQSPSPAVSRVKPSSRSASLRGVSSLCGTSTAADLIRRDSGRWRSDGHPPHGGTAPARWRRPRRPVPTRSARRRGRSPGRRSA